MTPLNPNPADHQTATLKIEYAALGEGFALHSLISNVIVLTNKLGLKICQGLLANISQNDIAAQLVREENIPKNEAAILCSHIIDSWQEAGLLDTAPLAHLLPATYRPIHEPYEESTFRFEQAAITIACEDSQLIHQFEEILQDYIADKTAAKNTTTIEITNDGDEFGIFINKQPIWGLCNQDLARGLVLREIASSFCKQSETAAILHAGSVAAAGKGSLIITAESRSGKSTLTAALVASGLNYLTDDLLPLHRDGKSVISFPTALGLKQGSWGLAEAKSLGFDISSSSPLPREGVLYRTMPNSLPLGTRSEVSAILFPRYDAQADNHLKQLPAEEALQKLMDAGGRVNRHLPSIIPITTLLNHVPAYEIEYSSSDYAVKRCLELLGVKKPSLL